MTDTTDRPLVTFAVIAYNQERFIREAIEGAFAQTYEPLEIILSDDCSPDRTYEIMQEMAAAYDGPHCVRLNRNDPNFGITGHFNKIMEEAEGAFVVVNAGDDVSLPNRTTASVGVLCRDSSLSYAETQFTRVSDNGTTLDNFGTDPSEARYCLDDLVNRSMTFCGAARTYRKSAISLFPPLYLRCPTEDTTNLLRCLLCGDGIVVAETGVQWRIHADNMSSSSSLRRMPLLQIYNQYKADIQHMQASGLLCRQRARRTLGLLAYWIMRRLASQQDRTAHSTPGRIRVLLGYRGISALERLFMIEALFARKLTRR